MEDLQNQQKAEGAPRRRRAVRSVPMGNQREQQTENAHAQVTAVPAEQIPTQKIPAQELAEPQISAAAPVREAVPPAVSDKISENQIPKAETEPTMAPRKTDEDAEASVFSTYGETAADVFSAEKTFSQDTKEPASPKRHFPFGWIAAAVLVLALCAVIMMPFLQKTAAVMLYVGDTAVGYIASERHADDGFSAVANDLRDSAFTAEPAYRCETESVQGSVALMSSDDIYDAMYAHATDGYVRAYRLYASNGSIDYAFGVMTEAEIYSAIDAAIAVCRTQYASNLPTDAVISASLCFAWEAAWISEDAIIDEGALVSRILEAQNTEYAMLAVTATVTETEAERIPYETTLVPNDDDFDGIRSMISPGADGLAQISYTVMLDPLSGAVLSRTESARTVVREPVSAVSYEGLYPLPDGVSTGTFSWPLPELPDDELPLDENGNPYMPENPLALKNTYVSSGYGERDLWGSYDFHLGLDIVAPAYTEIYAADGGVVVFAAYTSSYGYMTRIRHANNVETVYAHQIKQAVKAGDVVEKGQLIGYVGSTGNSSGSHLHLEFRRDHVTVDPLEYIAIPDDVLVLGEGY